jgi:ribosomal protein L16/L10AE
LIHHGAVSGASARRRRFRLRVAGGADPALLAGHANATNAAVRDGDVLFDLDGDDEAAADILRALVSAGVRVVGYAEASEGMQGRYLAMIGRRE